MMKTKKLVAGGAALLLGVIGVLTGAPANAVTTSTTYTAALNVDCSHITPAGLAYLQAHNVTACGVVAKGAKPAVTDTARGNCGLSSITMNNLGGGKAHIRWGFASTIGVANERDLNVEWYNDNTDKSGNIPDLFPMASENYTSNWYTETTGKGESGAQVSGVILVDFGILSCTLAVPFVNVKIT